MHTDTQTDTHGYPYRGSNTHISPEPEPGGLEARNLDIELHLIETQSWREAAITSLDPSSSRLQRTVYIGMGEEYVLWLLPPAQSSELSSQTGATRGLRSFCEGPLSTKMYQDSDLSFKRLLVPFL